jgi:hypothetical protein
MTKSTPDFSLFPIGLTWYEQSSLNITKYHILSTIETDYFEIIKYLILFY